MTAAGSSADAILTIGGLDKHFGGLRAVAGASFSVRRGSLTALIGPNGAGKTTLFDLVTGFASPDRGTILFDGRAIGGMSPHGICRLGLVRHLSADTRIRGHDRAGQHDAGFQGPTRRIALAFVGADA